MLEPKIQWKDKSGDWVLFNNLDIAHTSRNHVLRLFQQGTPVVAMENGKYLVNRSDLLEQYKAARKPVMLFADCESSEAPLARVGFTGKGE